MSNHERVCECNAGSWKKESALPVNWWLRGLGTRVCPDDRGSGFSHLQIPTSDWQKLLEELKFVVKFSSHTFLQFAPPPEEKLPLDLMFVSDEDFAKMYADAKQIDSDGFIAKVVSLPHLFALKCHAFKSRPLRAMKDIEDLVQLTRLNKLDLNEPVLRDNCTSMVDRNSMNSSNENATHFILSDAADLKFADWSGMKPHEIRMTPTEAFRWNEEMLALFPPRKISPKLEAECRCHAEFVL